VAPEALAKIEESDALLQHAVHGLVGVFERVPLGDFTGETGEAHLKDLAWLTPRALRHDKVIALVSRSSPVFPARFGTIFSSLDSLGLLMERHHDTIRSFLDRTAGTEEWGLKGYLDATKARETLVSSRMESQPAQLSGSAGLRYMQERRLHAQAETQLRHWLEETADRVRRELSAHSAESAERKLLPLGEPDPRGDMVINFAFLVPTASVKALREAGEALARELQEWGLSFEWAGPFPPYSFTPPLERQQP
jgi:hypothetical protein